MQRPLLRSCSQNSQRRRKNANQIRVDVANVLEARRKELGLSVNELAEQVRVAPSRLRKWLGGDIDFQLSELTRIMSALDLRVDIGAIETVADEEQ